MMLRLYQYQTDSLVHSKGVKDELKWKWLSQYEILFSFMCHMWMTSGLWDCHSISIWVYVATEWMWHIPLWILHRTYKLFVRIFFLVFPMIFLLVSSFASALVMLYFQSPYLSVNISCIIYSYSPPIYSEKFLI